MRYSNNKDFAAYVAELVRSGKWVYIPKGRRRHGCLQHESGRKCPVPCSPGNDPRGFLNFKAMTRQIESGLA